MKKIKLGLVALISIFLLPLLVEAKDAINVYLFKSSTCPHCQEAMEFFSELSTDSEYSSYFTLVPFETNGSTAEIKENRALATKVAKHFGKSFEGVPLIVIGDKYFEGYASDMDTELKDAIKESYNNNDYQDVVLSLQNGEEKNSNFDAIFTVLIGVVLVGGIAYFIYVARKDMSEESNSTSSKKTSKKGTTKKQKMK